MNARGRRRAIVIGAAVAAASVAAAVWWTILESPSRPVLHREDTSLAAAREGVVRPPSGARLASDGEVAHEADASAHGRVAGLEDIPHGTRVAAATADSSLDDIRIRGRVELPPGCGLDSSARIVRGAGTPDWLPPKSFELTADGTFEIPFPHGTSRAFLDFVGRSACLASPVRLEPLDPTVEVVLHATRASGLRGRLRFDAGMAREAPRFVGAKISAYNRVVAPSGDRRAIEAEVDEHLAFEIDGLDPNSSYQLLLRLDGRVRARSPRVQVVAGKRAEFELEVSSPARVSGRVVDAEGAPIANADVITTEVNDGWVRRTGRGSTRSRADGTFDAEIYEGAVLGVHAFKPGHRRKDVDIEPVDAGESRSDVVLVLERGPSVSGRVVWPDGTPAAGAHVEVAASYQFEALSFRPPPDYVQSTTTAADGAFHVDVSNELDVIVRARAPRTKIAELSPHEKSRWRSGPDWRVENRNVAPGAQQIVLTLQPNARIHGIVADDRGEPLQAFTVLAAMALDEHVPAEPNETLSRDVVSEHGEFAFANVSQGTWLVEVSSGHRAASQRVTLPGTPAPLRFVIPRTAKLRGIVIGADGRGVTDAVVFVKTPFPRPSWPQAPQTCTQSVSCSAGGVFEMDGVPSGLASAWATSGDRASAELRVELAPGSTIDDFVLALR